MTMLRKSQSESIWGQILPASARRHHTLQVALRIQLVQAILRGELPANTKLPSTRELAKLLSIARITVALTYERLATEGFLEPRKRVGYYVTSKLPKQKALHAPQKTEREIAPDWSTRIAMHNAQDKWLEKPRDWQTYPYPFVYGQLDPKLFPLSEWRDCSRLAQAVPDSSRWAADAVDLDDPMLITEIVDRVLTKRGIVAHPEEIIITLGTQMALYLLSQLLIAPGTVVGVEDPGYMDARNIFRRSQAQLVRLPVDADGVVLTEEMTRCSYLYCTPSHQCPTGATLSMERRMEMLRLASLHDFIVFEDDYDAETQFVGQPSPALKAIDRSGRVIYIGSFSKVLSPGLRIGYMVAPRELVQEARLLRRLIIRHPPTNNQRAMALFIAQGHYHRLLSRNRKSLEERSRCITAACRQFLPSWTFREALGGSALWLQVPSGISMREVSAEARKQGILIESGAVFFAVPAPPGNFVRLAYSTIPLEQIQPGIEKLALIVKACAKRKKNGHADAR